MITPEQVVIEIAKHEKTPPLRGYVSIPVDGGSYEAPVFGHDGDGQVTKSVVDGLVATGAYVVNWHWCGGGHDEPTAEPVDGNPGPRFGARNQRSDWWKVLDEVEFVEHEAMGL